MQSNTNNWHLVGVFAAVACIIFGVLFQLEAPWALVSLLPVLLVVFFQTNKKQKLIVAITVLLSIFLAVTSHHSGTQLITTDPVNGAILLSEKKLWGVFVFFELIVFVVSFTLFFVMRERRA